MNVNVWLKIQAKKGYVHWGAGKVACSKSKPPTGKNEVAIKVEVDIPDAYFETPEIRARIVIPPEAVNRAQIAAQVADNVGEMLSKQTGFAVRVSADETQAVQS